MPNRFQRFCCRYLKEWKTLDKCIMGIRKAESTKRDLSYEEPTECKFYGAKREENHVEAIYPILDWTDDDVVQFIEARHIQLHPLYYREDGTIDPKRRLGCMCCPLQYYKKRIQSFRQYPGMVRAYCRAAQQYRTEHPDVETVQKYDDVYEWFTRELFYERQEKWEYDKAHQLFGRPDYKQDLQDFFHVKL